MVAEKHGLCRVECGSFQEDIYRERLIRIGRIPNFFDFERFFRGPGIVGLTGSIPAKTARVALALPAGQIGFAALGNRQSDFRHPHSSSSCGLRNWRSPELLAVTAFLGQGLSVEFRENDVLRH